MYTKGHEYTMKLVSCNIFYTGVNRAETCFMNLKIFYFMKHISGSIDFYIKMFHGV